jgi:IS5 family transposase
MQIALTPPSKDKYKLRNWKNYNQNLCHRGSLTLYVSDSVLREWRDIDKNKKVVGEKTYPESIILCCLLLKMQYSQPLRQTTGFVKSLLSLAGYSGFSIPDYTTLCRRQNCLPVGLTKRWERGEKLAVAIDSTGLKVYGEGEWKVRKHGISKRRTWLKLHIAIDINTQEIVAVSLTANDKDDAEVAVEMLKDRVDKVKSFHGDGAYDDFKCRELLTNTKQIIPPPKDAVVHQATKRKPLKEYLSQRNKAVEFINQHDRKQWKINEGYHLRSRNETTMFRYKTAFGGEMQARKIENQQTEVLIKTKILNIHRDVGMPVSYRVA